MAGIHIPALQLKLRFLIDRGIFEDWQDLADAFGVSAKTLQWWGHGDGARAADTIPSRHYEKLITLIEDQLGNSLSRAEIKQLASTPYQQWCDDFSLNMTAAFSELIEEEAKPVDARLFLKPEREAGLIETEQTQPHSEPALVIQKNQWFRLEFDLNVKNQNLFALQNSGQQWGAVPSHYDEQRGVLHLPSLREEGQKAYMVERNDLGLHRFLIFQTTATPPAEYKRYLSENIQIDLGCLSRLAEFYVNLPANHRAIHLIAMTVID